MSYVTIFTGKTGRKRTLKLTGTFQCASLIFRQTIEFYMSGGGRVRPKKNVIRQGGGQLQVFQPNQWDVTLTPFLSVDGRGKVSPGGQGICTLTGGFDPTYASYFSFPYGYRFSSAFRIPSTGTRYTDPVQVSGGDYSGAGTWGLTAEVEEWFDVQIEINDDTGQPVFPGYGGRVQQEPPYSNKIVFYEVVPTGKPVTIVGSYAPCGLSASVTGYANANLIMNYNLYFAGLCAGRGQTLTYSPPLYPAVYTFDDDTCQMAILPDAGLNCYNLPLTVNYSGVKVGNVILSGSVDFSAGGLAMSYVSSSGRTLQEWLEASGSNAPLKSAKVSGAVYADKNLYPDKTSVTVRGDLSSQTVDVNGGVFSQTIQQRYGQALCRQGSDQGNVAYTPISVYQIDERQPLACYMTPSGMLANKDDANDWRMCWRGLPFPAFSLRQKPSLAVDTGASLNPTDATVSMPGQWSAAKPVTLTATGTYLSATVADSKTAGVVTRSFTDVETIIYGACFQGYRWLRIRIRGTKEGLPFTLRLSNQDGSKTWSLQTGAKDTFADVDVDLCDPHNLSMATDSSQQGADSQWPLEGDYTRYRIVDGPYSGVTHVSTLSLEGLQTTEVYDIAAITLVRKDHARVNFVPAFGNMVAEVSDDPLSNMNRVRMGLGGTDGRQSMEATDFQMDVLGNPIIRSLAELKNGCNVQRNGWIATLSTDNLPTDGYHNAGLDGVCAWGAGALYAKLDGDGNPGWHVGIDLDGRS